jgi:hypothetical protein
MLIIKGYYYFFAAFVFSLVAIADAFVFLKNIHHRPFKAKLPGQNITMVQQLHLGKL